MDSLSYGYYETEIGLIKVEAENDCISEVSFVEKKDKKENKNKIVEECIKQLDEYFKKERKEFGLKLKIEGTDFQKKVWEKLIEIPFSKTMTYGEVAEAVNNKKAVRAVGNANNKNKIGIIIPCHRVIGKDGSLTGYGGGLWRKEWLLKHEGIVN